MEYFNFARQSQSNKADVQVANTVSHAKTLVDNRPKAVAQFKQHASQDVVQLEKKKRKIVTKKPQKQGKKTGYTAKTKDTKLSPSKSKSYVAGLAAKRNTTPAQVLTRMQASKSKSIPNIAPSSASATSAAAGSGASSVGPTAIHNVSMLAQANQASGAAQAPVPMAGSMQNQPPVFAQYPGYNGAAGAAGQGVHQKPTVVGKPPGFIMAMGSPAMGLPPMVMHGVHQKPIATAAPMPIASSMQATGHGGGAAAAAAPPPAVVMSNQTYSQAIDPTLAVFLKGKKYIGEQAANQQISGNVPVASAVRVAAEDIQGDNAIGGAGLHEVLPTSYRNRILKDPALIGIQSGMRTSTAYTLLDHEHYNGSDEVGAHSGFFTGNQGTRGQAAAHDYLREAVDGLIQNPPAHTDQAVNTMLIAHLRTIPNGQKIVNSENIAGLTSKATGAKLEETGAAAARPNAVNVAQIVHRGRERVKRRTRTLKRHFGRGASPSPPRSPIQDNGTGGNYYSAAEAQAHLVEAMPNIHVDKGITYSESANMSAWATAPMRDGFK